MVGEKTFLGKYWAHIALVIVLILLFNQCNKSNDLIKSADAHEKKAKDYIVQARFKTETLNDEVADYKDKVDSLTKINNAKEQKLIDISNKVVLDVSKVKDYNDSEKTGYFTDRYNIPKSAFSTSEGIVLKDTICRFVITDLIVGDGAKAENKILKDVLSIEKNKFDISNKMVDSLNLGLEAISRNYELADKEKSNALKDVKIAYKKERNKTLLYKLTTLSALTLAGYILITK